MCSQFFILPQINRLLRDILSTTSFLFAHCKVYLSTQINCVSNHWGDFLFYFRVFVYFFGESTYFSLPLLNFLQMEKKNQWCWWDERSVFQLSAGVDKPMSNGPMEWLLKIIVLSLQLIFSCHCDWYYLDRRLSLQTLRFMFVEQLLVMGNMIRLEFRN